MTGGGLWPQILNGSRPAEDSAGCPNFQIVFRFSLLPHVGLRRQPQDRGSEDRRAPAISGEPWPSIFKTLEIRVLKSLMLVLAAVTETPSVHKTQEDVTE